MRRSIRCQAFKWVERVKRKVHGPLYPIVAYEAGYRAALADLTGQQYRRLTRVDQ